MHTVYRNTVASSRNVYASSGYPNRLISFHSNREHFYGDLNLNPLTWKIWWAPNNASKW